MNAVFKLPLTSDIMKENHCYKKTNVIANSLFLSKLSLYGDFNFFVIFVFKMADFVGAISRNL